MSNDTFNADSDGYETFDYEPATFTASVDSFGNKTVLFEDGKASSIRFTLNRHDETVSIYETANDQLCPVIEAEVLVDGLKSLGVINQL